MTDRKQALADLLEKVEAGEYPTQAQWAGVLPDTPEDDDYPRSMMATQANVGWLDAAKALHEAVLPGWSLTYLGQDPFDWRVAVFCENYGPRKEGVCPANPARAWLIAILKALIAQEGDT